MKSDFHFHFYSRIFIMLILAVSVFVIQKSVPSKAEIVSYPYEVTGWAWNDKSSWISLNCYNDFESPGDYFSTCNDTDYGLEISLDGTVSGCIWGGNNLSGGTSSVGWICFDEYTDPGDRITPSDFVVTTSSNSNFPNALATTTFASILSLENWLCVDGIFDGQRCGPTGNTCSSGGGVCTFTDNQKWKLGFPLAWGANFDDDMPEIEGCFNCYERVIYKCESNTDPWDPECDPNNNTCGLVGTAPNQYQDACVAIDIEKNCDNCLEYFYYPGRCVNTDPLDSIPDGTVSTTMECQDLIGAGDADCCKNNSDCSTGETCQPVRTLRIAGYNPSTGNGHYEEYECYHSENYGLPGETTLCTSYCGSWGDPTCDRELGELRKTIGGYKCSDCTIESYDNRCTLNADQKNLNTCNSCQSYWYQPGVIIDNRHYGWSPDGNNDLDPDNTDPAPDDIAYMCGWAWNAWDSDLSSSTNPIEGFYWFNFSPRVVTSTKAYLYADSGNIYSQKGLSSDYLPPYGAYNSSFLIESGGAITNYVSSSTLAGAYQGELPYQSMINFLNLDPAGRYSNALGSIDYNGLVDIVNLVSNTNKYGSYVYNGVPLATAVSLLADRDQVFYYNSTTTLNSGSFTTHNFALGNDASEVASKTIVVNGDLILGDNIGYATSSSAFSNFKNIPSTVWIVRGDLLIDADVTEIAGTFIVLGKSGLAGSCAEGPAGAPPTAGCGRIVTCYDTNIGLPYDCRTAPLRVKGNVFARYFDLGRTYIDPINPTPSERFINDGRLQVNPPAGFIDFSNIVPRFSEP